jgi:hypothetical protein
MTTGATDTTAHYEVERRAYHAERPVSLSCRLAQRKGALAPSQERPQYVLCCRRDHSNLSPAT